MALLLVSGLALWRSLHGVTLLLRGRYPEAREFWSHRTDAWLKSTADSARYNVALCLHHEGQLEAAEAALRDLATRNPPGILAGMTSGLLGSTLVLQERASVEAGELLLRGHDAFPARSTYFWLAHVALGLGDRAGAQARMQEAEAIGGTPGTKLGVVSARIDATLLEAVDGYLLGWYHERCGELGLARAAFERASSVPRQTIYVDRARAALRKMPTVTVVVEEGPNSLGPFVLP